MHWNFYNKYFKRKLFNRIFFIYSAVIVLSLLVLSTILSMNLTQTLKQKELNFNKQVLEKISFNFNQKYYSSVSLVQQFYANREASSDLVNYLNLNFDDYITKRLDAYSKIQSDTMFRFQTYIESYFSSDHDISSVVLYSRKRKSFSIISAKNSTAIFDSNDGMQKLMEKLTSKNHQFYPCLFSNSDSSSRDQKVYSVIVGVNSPESLGNCGAFLFNYDIDSIYRTYSGYVRDLKGYIVILTNNGKVLFDSSGKYYGAIYPYFSKLKESQNALPFEEKSYINLIQLPDSGAVIAGIIPVSQVAAGTHSMQRTISLITLLLILVSLLLSYLVVVTFSRRTRAIMQGMEALKAGNLTARVPIDKGEDELSQIAVNFNNMCDSLNDYIKKVYMSEIKQKHAELAALQNQINPHFLYNTLESIRMKAVLGGAPKIGEMVYLLATIFRNTVKSKTFVSIGEELEQCRLYLKLFKIRYEDTFTYEIDVDDKILNNSIVKFTLQPIIENYIAHGIKRDSPDNSLTLSGYMKDGDIHFIISDNGIGIEKKRLLYLQDMLAGDMHEQTRSIGLTNVNDRLKIIYGSQYGLDINSEENIGTSVEIRIPVKKKEDNADYVQGIFGR